MDSTSGSARLQQLIHRRDKVLVVLHPPTAAHARVMEAHGLTRHRLNACGYSLGARFTPSWMDMPMFFAGNPEPIAPDMTLFAHMIIMDSETETAMTLGRTYLTTEGEAKPLSRHALDLIVR
jgi:Xaa-Pro dipeptidase